MISVLLPVYNGGKYISTAVKSILNQTYKNFELLIIDDGSTDGTERVIKLFNDKRINYIRKKHSGLADTLNFGLKIAKYDWVARMDADDISHPERLNEQIKAIEPTKENYIILSWAAFFNNNKILFTVDTPIKDNELKKKLALHCYINHPSVLYNRKFILSNGGYNTFLRSFVDFELWLRIKNKTKFITIPKYLIFINERKNSLSRSNSNKKIVFEYLNRYYPLETKTSAFTEKEIKEILGWREYFYGKPKLARKYWIQNFVLLSNYRILLAFIITFFPLQFIIWFKSNQVKLKLKYLVNNLFDRDWVPQKELDFLKNNFEK